MLDPNGVTESARVPSEPRSRVTSRVVMGLIVIVLGVVFTLDNLGFLDAGEVLRWWPVVLIGYGALRLSGYSSRRNPTAGILFLVVGSWILLDNLGLISYNVWEIWPVILIAVGVTMVTNSLRRMRERDTGGAAEPAARMIAFAFMSGTHQRIVSPEFRGGDLTAIMGSHEVDLRSAKLATGEATLDLLVWWGGVELMVPENWSVDYGTVAIMGAVVNHTKPASGPVQGRILLRGLVLMGGVEVKN